MPFPNSSRSDGVQSSGCPIYVLDVERVSCIWRFGTHGVGTRQYSSTGAPFAGASSPSLSGPRVSSLRSHPAVGLDVVNPVASQPLNQFCNYFSLSHCLFFLFIIYFCNAVSLNFIAAFPAAVQPLDSLKERHQ